ncbi:MAG: hypothetical protein ACLP5V_08280 [Candidatus Bathyarchaeia archaeon]
MKSAIIGLIIALVIVIVLLATPWYPVVTNRNVSQTFAYTYQIASQSYQFQNVYTLQNPITLQGLFQSGATLSQAYQDLGDITLQANSQVAVTINECSVCGLSISKDFGDKETVYSVSGSSSSGDFLVPDSGQYKMSVLNLGTTSNQVNSISITANIPQNSAVSQVGYNTVEARSYSVVGVAPSFVIGLLPSITSLALIAIIVVVLVLFDKGILIIGTRRRRRR